MIKLKPCPFCGQQAIRVSHPGTNWDGSGGKNVTIGAMHNLWYVGCPAPFFEDITGYCEIHPSASWYVDLEVAERHWNKRANKKG